MPDRSLPTPLREPVRPIVIGSGVLSDGRTFTKYSNGATVYSEPDQPPEK